MSVAGDSNAPDGRETAPTPTDSTFLRYSYVQFITEHLADCSRVFRGDLQEMLVLAVIGQYTMDVTLRAPSSQTVRFLSTGMSASRIADVTGIPRETVRRKLLSLQDKGWVEQARPSSWCLTFDEGRSVAGKQLADLDARGIGRAERFLSAISARRP